MKAFRKDGPKRRRAVRRETIRLGKQGYTEGTTNFKREREARMLKEYKSTEVPQPRGGC